MNNTGVTFVLMGHQPKWAIYPPMFNYLSLLIVPTVLLDSVLLGTNIYVGR